MSESTILGIGLGKIFAFCESVTGAAPLSNKDQAIGWINYFSRMMLVQLRKLKIIVSLEQTSRNVSVNLSGNCVNQILEALF